MTDKCVHFGELDRECLALAIKAVKWRYDSGSKSFKRRRSISAKDVPMMSLVYAELMVNPPYRESVRNRVG